MKLTYSLKEGRIPLNVVVEKGHIEAVDILVTHDADANRYGTCNRYMCLHTGVSMLYCRLWPARPSL